MYSIQKIAKIVIKKIFATDLAPFNGTLDFSDQEINLGKMVHWQQMTEEECKKQGYFEDFSYCIWGLSLGFRFIEMTPGNDTLLNRIMSEGEKNDWWGLELLSHIVEIKMQGKNGLTTNRIATVFKLTDDQREVFAKPLVVREVKLQMKEVPKKV